MSLMVLPAPTLADAARRGHLGGETAAERGARIAHEKAAQDLAAFIEDVEWMADTGESTEDVARRRGVTANAINKRLTRAGRTDLWDRLRANEVRRFGETLGDRRARENGQSCHTDPRSRWF